MGQERLAMILEARGQKAAERRPELFFVSADEGGAREALRLATALRKAGVPCDLDARGGKLARQFKHAERVGARYAVVLGSSEVASGQAKLKELATRAESPVALADLAARFAPKRG
jgi:histidyl-tRNA synthetase